MILLELDLEVILYGVYPPLSTNKLSWNAETG